MPLTPFQEAVARRLAEGRSPDSYLAGGAALHIEPNSLRYSNDLDYFNDSAERVATAFADDRRSLQRAGYEVLVQVERDGLVRAIVRRGSDATKVEWVHDTAWRFLPVIKSAVAGFTLHPLDLAINKVLALVGRGEPRDFLDTLDIIDRTLLLGPLIWAGSGKDPGFTPKMLLGMLRRSGRYHPEDFARLRLTRQPSLPDLKQKWLAALDEADEFLASRPPDDIGCLYYSRALRDFPRDPTTCDDVVPHFGRPGGVLPLVG